MQVNSWLARAEKVLWESEQSLKNGALVFFTAYVILITYAEQWKDMFPIPNFVFVIRSPSDPNPIFPVQN